MGFLDWFKNLFCKDILEENLDLKNQLKIIQTKNPKEEYYNNKYPKVNLTYLRHETDADYQIDLRDFYMLNDANIPIIVGKSDDEIALNSLNYILKNITYVDDKTDYNYDEYWAFPFQTIKRKKGDCEDGAILLANILVKSGIPYWKVRLTCANVDDGKGNSGGHCFVTYYCEKQDKFVLLDWCYYPNKLPIEQRKNYDEETFYKASWFSWNNLYCFSEDVRTANKYLKPTNKKV